MRPSVSRAQSDPRDRFVDLPDDRRMLVASAGDRRAVNVGHPSVRLVFVYAFLALILAAAKLAGL